MSINYPYLPTGRTFAYVSPDNEFMQVAKAHACRYSLDDSVKTGTVVVKDGVIIGQGTNGSDYHKTHVCERVRQNIPTGQGYELCEGCHPKNHSERRAIATAIAAQQDLAGADLYLWGHWWCCQSCWEAIESAGIATVYLQEGSEVLFNKNHPDNIIGKQCS